MGYRYYMYIVPKTLVNDIQDLSYDQLKQYAASHNAFHNDDEDGYLSFFDLLGRNEFHCFGKYYEHADQIYKLGEPLFSNPDTQKCFEDYAPYVVGANAVLSAIEDYKQKIIKVYEDLLLTQEEYDQTHDIFERSRFTQEHRIRNHLESQLNEWKNPFGFDPLVRDLNDPRINRSWLYEYEVFDLVHKYKTMDWQNNALIFCGW